MPRKKVRRVKNLYLTTIPQLELLVNKEELGPERRE